MAGDEELDFEELQDNPLLAEHLELEATKGSKKKDGKVKGADVEPTHVVIGGQVEGEVSAWYPGKEGLLGEHYGYISRTVGEFTVNGITVQRVESYCFNGSDAAPECLAKLDVRWRNLRVAFRPAGIDACGRKKAVQVSCSSRKRPSTTPAKGSGQQPPEAASRKKPREAAAAPAPLDPPPAAQTPAVSSVVAAEEGDEAAAPKKPSEVASGLIRKALKKLGGEATKGEVVERIETSAKLLRVAEEHLGDLEIQWQEYISRRVKKVCEATGYVREGLKGSDAKIFRWCAEAGE